MHLFPLGVGRLSLGIESSFNQVRRTGFRVASTAWWGWQWGKEIPRPEALSSNKRNVNILL